MYFLGYDFIVILECTLSTYLKKKVCRETTCAVRRRRPHAAHACCVSRSRRFSCARFHLALLRAVPRCTVRCLNAAGHAARPRRVAGCVTEVSVRTLRDVRTAAASHDAALLRTYPPTVRRSTAVCCHTSPLGEVSTLCVTPRCKDN